MACLTQLAIAYATTVEKNRVRIILLRVPALILLQALKPLPALILLQALKPLLALILLQALKPLPAHILAILLAALTRRAHRREEHLPFIPSRMNLAATLSWNLKLH